MRSWDLREVSRGSEEERAQMQVSPLGRRFLGSSGDLDMAAFCMAASSSSASIISIDLMRLE